MDSIRVYTRCDVRVHTPNHVLRNLSASSPCHTIHRAQQNTAHYLNIFEMFSSVYRPAPFRCPPLATGPTQSSPSGMPSWVSLITMRCSAPTVSLHLSFTFHLSHLSSWCFSTCSWLLLSVHPALPPPALGLLFCLITLNLPSPYSCPPPTLNAGYACYPYQQGLRMGASPSSCSLTAISWAPTVVYWPLSVICCHLNNTIHFKNQPQQSLANRKQQSDTLTSPTRSPDDPPHP